MPQPKDRIQVSVVVPTYQRPELLLKCIRALYAQRCLFLFEVIVVSDGPDGNTAQAVSSLDLPHFRFLQLPVKMGPAAARNYGWRRAAGELIAFTDDDCLPDTRWLSKLYEAYLKEDLVLCAFSGRTIVPLRSSPTDYELSTSKLESAPFITANCAVSRLALTVTDGFDEHFEMAWREDSDMQMRLQEQNIPILPVEAVVVHPVRPPTWGASLKAEKKGMYDILLLKKHPHRFAAVANYKGLLHYYVAMVLFFATMILGVIVAIPLAIIAGLAGWFSLWFAFVIKRLTNTRRSFRDIFEIITTSAFIPFLSLYWKCYGLLKFRGFQRQAADQVNHAKG
jgi:glycosyltransferase involved in cell wall biosynthesis